MSKFRQVIVFIGLFMLIMSSVATAREGRLMRFPDIHNDKIVFTYGGDLWIVSDQGGQARRLTTGDGFEYMAKFSPDGSQIAFTGQYEGGTHVYVMPSEGGQPKQLTFHPSSDLMVDWYPDGNKIMFHSGREYNRINYGKLFAVDFYGGLPEKLILPETGLGSLSPDAKKIAYNRRFNENRTWKRYKGGTQQDVWIYDFANNEIEKITDWIGNDNSPMWHGNKVYFNSDRDHTLNIYAYDIDTRQTEKITDYKRYDVKWPSVGPGEIVYENGGYLHVLDLESGQSRKVDIEIRDDLVLTRPEYKDAGKQIRSMDISPGGERAVFGARGEIFTVPREKGPTRNLTRTPGIREIHPTWSPDGKYIAYFSDKPGEYELYIRPQDGSGEEERITFNGDCYRFQPKWSPDSKKLMWVDSDRRLQYVDIENKKTVDVDQAFVSQIHSFNWSPDSKWILYTKNAPHFFESIYLYSLSNRQTRKLTDDFTDDVEPVFDSDGKYLYFISLRNFDPVFSDFEHQFVNRNSRILLLMTLKADEPHPFKLQSDEVELKEDDEKEDKDDEDKDEDEKGKNGGDDIEIDFEGLDDRIVGVPVGAGFFYGLTAAKDKLFFLSRTEDGESSLKMFDMKEREEETVISGVNSYTLSADGQKIMYRAGNSYGIIDAKKGQKTGDGQLSLSDLKVRTDPKAEWEQMFSDAWRLMRDFFYDPNMHGVDWDAMKDRYGAMLPWVAHRSDLNYLLGEMVGELSVSHAYVSGGEYEKPDSRNIGLLGVDLAVEAGSRYYQIEKIYPGKNWYRGDKSPLKKPGVEVKQGDYLISVNRQEIQVPDNPYPYFEQTSRQQTLLAINDQPSPEGAREYMVIPTPSEYRLRHYDWVENNRSKVSEATDGRVGYIHVPNTGGEGLNEFMQGFLAQSRKDGLIIDVRHNQGGMIPDMFVERLSRKILSYWATRDMVINRTPNKAFLGPMVCIIDEFAGSGGDAFPYYFRELGLGPLIGNTTWGGLVGISRNIPLMDGGRVTFPEFAFINLEGQWDVENEGVEPDIPVDNRPDLVISGKDPQLEKAIEEVLKQLRDNPPEEPKKPEFPTRN